MDGIWETNIRANECPWLFLPIYSQCLDHLKYRQEKK